MRATVRSASGVTSEVSDWVSVGARGDKHEVKRYARELESLCRPLAAVDSAVGRDARGERAAETGRLSRNAR